MTFQEVSMNKDTLGILCLHIPMLLKWKVVKERGVQPLLMHQNKKFHHNSVLSLWK